jgi:hypothetical protein
MATAAARVRENAIWDRAAGMDARTPPVKAKTAASIPAESPNKFGMGTNDTSTDA